MPVEEELFLVWEEMMAQAGEVVFHKREEFIPTLYYVAKPSIRNPRYKHFSLVITASR